MSSGDIPRSCANCVVFKSLCWHFQLFVVVQLLSHTWLSVTPWTAARQASLSFTISLSFSDSCPLSWRCYLTISSSATLFLLLSSIFSRIRVSSNELVLCNRWPKCWSFSISPSSEHSGLISFRIDWFDLLAIQGTLKHLHHNLKASVLQCSAFSMVLLFYPSMTTGKTIALIIQIFVGEVMSLLFNMLSIGLKFKVLCTCILTFLNKMTVKLPGVYINYLRALRHSSEAGLLSTLM